jgi:hypothetical protein
VAQTLHEAGKDAPFARVGVQFFSTSEAGGTRGVSISTPKLWAGAPARPVPTAGSGGTVVTHRRRVSLPVAGVAQPPGRLSQPRPVRPSRQPN